MAWVAVAIGGSAALGSATSYMGAKKSSAASAETYRGQLSGRSV